MVVFVRILHHVAFWHSSRQFAAGDTSRHLEKACRVCVCVEISAAISPSNYAVIKHIYYYYDTPVDH
jgi:hypothetical protein